jgi:hypothetical protein
MGKVGYFLGCLAFALVLGLTWGVLLYTMDQESGLAVGFTLFVLGFKALYHPRQDEMPKRRFND